MASKIKILVISEGNETEVIECDGCAITTVTEVGGCKAVCEKKASLAILGEFTLLDIATVRDALDRAKEKLIEGIEEKDMVALKGLENMLKNQKESKGGIETLLMSLFESIENSHKGE